MKVKRLGVAITVLASTPFLYAQRIAPSDWPLYTLTQTLPAHAAEMALSPDESILYVRDDSGCCDGSWIRYQATSPYTNLGSCAVPGLPWSGDISPDGSTLWTNVYYGGLVRAIEVDPPTCTVTCELDVGNWTNAILLDDVGAYVYIGENAPGTNAIGSIRIVDTATCTEAAESPITLNGEPGRIEKAVGDPYLYVITRNPGSERLYKISTQTRSVSATMDMFGWGGRLMGFSVSPDGTTLFVAAYSHSAVYVVDTASLSVVDTFVVSSPSGAFIAPTADHLLIPQPDQKQITSMDLCGNVIQTIPYPESADVRSNHFTFTGDGNKVFVPGRSMALVLQRTPSGDVDLDGDVDLTDLGLLLSHFGRALPTCP